MPLLKEAHSKRLRPLDGGANAPALLPSVPPLAALPALQLDPVTLRVSTESARFALRRGALRSDGNVHMAVSYTHLTLRTKA